jgi:branched-subunit amino acid transport protein
VTLATVLVVAALTYASRALAAVLMPVPSKRVERVLDRIPAPLFAALASIALVDADGSVADVPVLAAAAGALVLARTRSLLVVLLGGVAGYSLGLLVS